MKSFTCQAMARVGLMLNAGSCLLKCLIQNNLCLQNFSYMVRLVHQWLTTVFSSLSLLMVFLKFSCRAHAAQFSGVSMIRVDEIRMRF